MSTTALVAALVMAFAPVDTIRVGSVPHMLPLAVGVDTVDNYVVAGGERQHMVTFVQTITAVDEGYLIVQENQRGDGSLFSLDSIVVSAGDLAPVWHGDVTPAGSRHVAFSNGRVSGIHVDTLSVETGIDEPVLPGLFDYSLMTLVLDHLPLVAGYEGTLATYDVTRGPVWVSFRVVGSEPVRLGDSTFEAWKMEVDVGPQTVTRWVERDTGRELRWEIEVDGRRMVGERRSS